MSGQPEINTSLLHPETCQEGQMNPRNRETSWMGVGVQASAKKSCRLLQEKNKISIRKKNIESVPYIIFFFTWQNVLSHIYAVGAFQRKQVLFITLFSHSLFKDSLLCSHIFFNSTICSSFVSLMTCDSRTRVWTVKNGKINNHSRDTFGISQCWQQIQSDYISFPTDLAFSCFLALKNT